MTSEERSRMNAVSVLCAFVGKIFWIFLLLLFWKIFFCYMHFGWSTACAKCDDFFFPWLEPGLSNWLEFCSVFLYMWKHQRSTLVCLSIGLCNDARVHPDNKKLINLLHFPVLCFILKKSRFFKWWFTNASRASTLRSNSSKMPRLKKKS